MADGLVPAARAPDAVLRGHLVDVQALAFVSTPAGQLLASGSLDGLVYLWDVAHPGAPVHKWVAHGGGLVSLTSLGPGQLWSQGRDGWVYLWRIGAADDGYGGHVLTPPVLSAALPVGFGSFCRMHVTAATGDLSPSPSSFLLAAPSLDSEKIEVWAADVADDAGGSTASAEVDADSGSGGGDAAITGSITGATLTRVHADSAHPAAFGGELSPAQRHRGTFRLLAAVAVPRARTRTAPASAAGGAGGSGDTSTVAAADLEAGLQPAAVGDVVTSSDADFDYASASAADASDGLEPDDPARFSALRALQGRSGMVAAVQLLDPEVAVPGLAAAVAAATAARAARRRRVTAQCDDSIGSRTVATVARNDGSANTSGGSSGGDAAVLHPLPQAGSLRELFALRAAATAAAPLADAPAVVPSAPAVTGQAATGLGASPPPAAPAAEASALALLRRQPPAFLLAAAFENGRFYVLADAPPPRRLQRWRQPPQAAVARRWPRGLTQLHDEDDDHDGDSEDDDGDDERARRGAGAASDAPVDAAQRTVTHGAVLVDIHLSADPLLTFTLGGGYCHGVAAGAGGDVVVFSLDIPRRGAAVTRRIPLAKPGASVSTLLAGCASGWRREAASDRHGDASDAPLSVAVVGGWDGTARLVDVPTGAQLAALHWHGVSVYSLAAAPVPAADAGDDGGLDGGLDGGGYAGGYAQPACAAFRVATGSKDGRVALWTVEVGQGHARAHTSLE